MGEAYLEVFMKKLLFPLFILCIGGIILLFLQNHAVSNRSASNKNPVTISQTPQTSPTQTTDVSPLAISAMKNKSYSGSDITIEQTLAPGSNYNRYLVSYRSDGLKIFGLLTIPQGQKSVGGW